MSGDDEDHLIAGRYRLVELLGRGGFGVVWRAVDEVLRREVAVKEMRLPVATPGTSGDALIRRAVAEASTAAALDHPSIVTVHDVLVDRGRPWIIMKLIRGRTLHQIVSGSGPLSEADTAHHGLRLLEGLMSAHAKGVLHRDVKPENVMIDEQGNPLLTDFSIAKAVGVDPNTVSGMIMGTPGFIPPERLTVGRAGASGDLFALGATLYYAVEGRPPFDLNGLDGMAAVYASARHPHRPPRRAPKLAPLLEGLLVKDPAGRLRAEQARRMLTDLAPPVAVTRLPGTSVLPGQVRVAGPERHGGRGAGPAVPVNGATGAAGRAAAPPPRPLAATAVDPWAGATGVPASPNGGASPHAGQPAGGAVRSGQPGGPAAPPGHGAARPAASGQQPPRVLTAEGRRRAIGYLVAGGVLGVSGLVALSGHRAGAATGAAGVFAGVGAGGAGWLMMRYPRARPDPAAPRPAAAGARIVDGATTRMPTVGVWMMLLGLGVADVAMITAGYDTDTGTATVLLTCACLLAAAGLGTHLRGRAKRSGRARPRPDEHTPPGPASRPPAGAGLPPWPEPAPVPVGTVSRRRRRSRQPQVGGGPLRPAPAPPGRPPREFVPRSRLDPRTAPIRRRRPRLMLTGLTMAGVGAVMSGSADASISPTGGTVVIFGLALFVLGTFRRRIG